MMLLKATVWCNSCSASSTGRRGGAGKGEREGNGGKRQPVEEGGNLVCKRAKGIGHSYSILCFNNVWLQLCVMLRQGIQETQGRDRLSGGTKVSSCGLYSMVCLTAGLCMSHPSLWLIACIVADKHCPGPLDKEKWGRCLGCLKVTNFWCSNAQGTAVDTIRGPSRQVGRF